jgi:hypothetical protein
VNFRFLNFAFLDTAQCSSIKQAMPAAKGRYVRHCVFKIAVARHGFGSEKLRAVAHRVFW